MTEQIYYEDAYLAEAEVTVTNIQPRNGGVVFFELDRTPFYPEGGGQPADQGTVETATGSIKVNTVRTQDGAILHEGKMTGTVEPGQAGTATIKWSRREKYMRMHSAGHLVHDVLMRSHPELKPVRGKHGDKAFLEYVGSLDAEVQSTLESEVNDEIAADHPIRTWSCTYDELVEMCGELPANLPTDKDLRVLKIGDFEPMPDGGVQVAKTGEIGHVVIHHITQEDGRVTIRYGVTND